MTHGSVKIHSPVEAAKIHQQVPEKDVYIQDLHIEIKRWSVGKRRESPARDSESAIGHSGSALSGQCSWFGENRCPDSAPDSGERMPSKLCHQWDGGGVSGVWTCRVLFYEENLEKLKSLCSLSRLRVAYLESRKVPRSRLYTVFLDCPILSVDGGKNCVSLSKETHGNFSNWTLPSSACVTALDISS